MIDRLTERPLNPKTPGDEHWKVSVRVVPGERVQGLPPVWGWGESGIHCEEGGEEGEAGHAWGIVG
jgi:hypothetical protein